MVLIRSSLIKDTLSISHLLRKPHFKDHEWQGVDTHGSKGKCAACSVVMEFKHLNFPTLNPPGKQLERKETVQTH